MTQFLSEVYAISGDSPVKVVCWDARAYEVVEAKSRADVINKVLERLRGYGGTVIEDALKTTLKSMRLRDAVVVLTDGEIYDIDRDGTRRLLSDVASRASVAVFVSTRRELNIPGWRFVKMETAD
ncbi:MAG: hypothetical protein QXT14_02905 [Candidatus Bathyarchaeia archaeon]